MPEKSTENLLTIEKLKQLPADKRQEFVNKMAEDPEAAVAFFHQWRVTARPEQLAPEEFDTPGEKQKSIWFIKAGRGFGKTRSAAEFVKEMVEDGRARHIGLGGANPGEIRKIMLEGVSGLLTIYPDDHPNKPVYIENKKEVRWPCGAVAALFSGEVPDKPRGDEFDLVWCDEVAAWKYPEQVWDNLQFCMRLNGPKGDMPRIVVTTTPKPIKLIRDLLKDPHAVVTGGSSRDNMQNLSQAYRRVIERYEGTRLGRQEIDADVLDQDENALWRRKWIDEGRVTPDLVPPLKRIVVSIDPMASKKGAEKRKMWKPESGIVVLGLGEDNHVYCLRDISFTSTPAEWATAAIEAYHDYEANLIVLETNQGGDMAEDAIAMREPYIRVKRVHARDGKWTRAEPVALMAEKMLIHHVGTFGELEDQLCNWSGKSNEPSPDRLDAYVHGATYLFRWGKSWNYQDSDLDIDTGTDENKWAI